jgi:Skp family chaperone for outer membrane proteins
MKCYKGVGLILAVCLVLTAGPLLVSAQKNEEPAQTNAVKGQEGKPQMKENAEVPDESQGKIEAYKKDLQKELRAMDQKTATLGKKIEKKGEKLKAEAKENWTELKAKQKVARNKLNALSSASKEGWEKAKAEAEAARDALRKAYDKVASYFD